MSQNIIQWSTPQPNPLQYSFGIGNLDTLPPRSDEQQQELRSSSNGQSSERSFMNGYTTPPPPHRGLKRGRRSMVDSDDDEELEMGRSSGSSSPTDSQQQQNDSLRATGSGLSNYMISHRSPLSSAPKRFRLSSSHSPSANGNNTSTSNSSPNRIIHNTAGTSSASLTSSATGANSSNLQVSKLLANLDKDQLSNIISAILSIYPFLQSHVAALIPRPTLQTVTVQIHQAEKKLVESYPYSKHGPDRHTDYAFNRVRAHLYELRDLIVSYLSFFISPSSYPPNISHEYPYTAFGYLHYVTTLTHRLPNWDSTEHNNETKYGVYDILTKSWITVFREVGRRVREEGKMYGEATLGEWARNFMLHHGEVHGSYGFGEALDVMNRELGSVLGLSMNFGEHQQQQGMGFPMMTGRPVNANVTSSATQYPLFQRQ